MHDVTTPEIIGDCPHEGPLPSSCTGFPPSDIPSSDIETGPCWGFRNRPKPDQELFTPVSGFKFEGALQFFGLQVFGAAIRAHSCLWVKWDPCGRLDFVQLDNFKADIAPPMLWMRSRSHYNTLQLPSSALEPSSCPVLPPCSAESDEYDETAGCLLSLYALRGTYGHASSELPISACIASSFMPSTAAEEGGIGPDDTDPVGSSAAQLVEVATRCCHDTVPIKYPARIMCDQLHISSSAPTLEEIASEIDLRFDSAGKLMKVYFGGDGICDDNPCVWDRNHPPEGTAGVAVPIIQFVNDSGTSIQKDKNFRLWFWYFDSCGQYLKACHYATLCGCDMLNSDVPSSDINCPCVTEACIFVDGECFQTIHYVPPEFAVFECAKAVKPDFTSHPLECGDLQDGFCDYLHTELACVVDSSDELYASCSGVRIDDSAGDGAWCTYITDDICAPDL